MSAVAAAPHHRFTLLPRHARTFAARSTTARRGAVVPAAVAVLVGVSGATTFAFWTTPGSGAGSGGADDVASVTVRSTSAAVTGLFPGGPAQPVSGSFDNDNPGEVYVHAVTVGIDGVTGGLADPALPACTAADFVLTQPASTNTRIAHGSTVGSWGGATIAMVNATRDQGNCRGAAVTLSLSST